MSWLFSVYIAATVFGVGITVIDLFGLIGSHEGGVDHDGGAGDHDAEIGDHGGDYAGDHGIDHDFDHEGGAGDHDAGVGGHEAGHEGDSGIDHAVDHTADHADHGEHEGSLAGHDRPARRGFLLSLLTGLRYLIYFCLGFGPVGWFALATGTKAAGSLIWSVPVGAVALVGTRLLRRFMRRELNSEVKESELLMEKGEVIVSIGRGELGRVRIRLGDIYVERFARAASEEAEIHAGAQVRVTEVGEDCVYVEEE